MRCHIIALLLFPLCVHSADLVVNFDATILEPTCNVYIADNAGGSGAGNSAEIKFNDVQLDQIINHDSNAYRTFSLVMSDCSPGIGKLKTTIYSTPAPFSPQVIGNSSAGGAQDVGVEIAREQTPNAPFTLNSSADDQSLVWSSDEVDAKKVALRATLVAGQAPTMGGYLGTATFETTYE
ncbi:fimbrial protein [Citrobacter arsenatis]|uniref:fimbrial protein n=1 Tax=Citrobacter arsenatis TaxID=2546350 RepID=UPI00300E2564